MNIATGQQGHTASACRGDHAHHGPRDCRGGQCTFLSSSRSVDDWRGPRLQVFLTSRVRDLAHLLGISFDQQSRPTGHPSLPVRLHLVNHVLLI